MFFYERNKYFVRKWSGLTELRIRTDSDVLFGYAFVNFDFSDAGCRSLWIMTEQSSRNAKQSVLDVKFIRMFDRRCEFFSARGFLHTCGQL